MARFKVQWKKVMVDFTRRNASLTVNGEGQLFFMQTSLLFAQRQRFSFIIIRSRWRPHRTLINMCAKFCRRGFTVSIFLLTVKVNAIRTTKTSSIESIFLARSSQLKIDPIHSSTHGLFEETTV